MYLLKISFAFCIIVNIFAVNGQQQCVTPDGEMGRCIPTMMCSKLVKILNEAPRPLPMSVANYLRKYHCGFLHNDPLSCCDSNMVTTTTTTTTTTTVNSRMENLFPEDCGPISSDKISGGNRTSLFEYPWMVLLQYQTNDGLEFLCGGSLVNERYVLTAAHCVAKLRDRNRLVSVRLGEHNIDTEIDCQILDDENICTGPVQDIPVEEIIPHPDYDRPRWTNDIALIRLSKPANMTPENVRAICLPTTKEYESKLPNRVSISGWGTTENQRPSNELLQASLPVVSNEECQKQFKSSIQIIESQMCAGGEIGVDSCKGDSGGPLVYPAYIMGTKMVQFGIISAGIDSCSSTTNFPGIYTRVSFYMPWILSNIRK